MKTRFYPFNRQLFYTLRVANRDPHRDVDDPDEF